MDLLFEPNKVYTDEFGRVSGLFLVDKPVGLTSHDLVYEYRKKFNTPKVGHAGALDPFATGLVIILVGKALKLSESFLNLDKEYEAEILTGLSTITGDPEGKINQSIEEEQDVTEEDLQVAFKKVTPEYRQYVPIFSSVKVNGEKLRVLARNSDHFEFRNTETGREVDFYKNNKLIKAVELPSKVVKIYNLKCLSISKSSKDEVWEALSRAYYIPHNKKEESLAKENTDPSVLKLKEYNKIKINVACSKGTYIRQLAVDIGNSFSNPLPAFLTGLRRTRVGEYKL